MSDLNIHIGPAHQAGANGAGAAPTPVNGKYETLELPRETIAAWLADLGKYQRDFTEAKSVKIEAQEIAARGGEILDTIALCMEGSKVRIINGQHRLQAGMLSGCPVLKFDACWYEAPTVEEQREIYLRLQKQLVRTKPADRLKALAATSDAMRKIMAACPFLVFGAGGKTKVSVGPFLQNWFHGVEETPADSRSLSIEALVESVEAPGEATTIIRFAKMVHSQWLPEEVRVLWAGPTMTLISWMYRRLVLEPSNQVTALSDARFRDGLAEMSADDNYKRWILNRKLSELDRKFAYRRVKELFSKRLRVVMGRKPSLPKPEWS